MRYSVNPHTQAQLRDKVNKHADHFANQKQLSQDSIRSLQNKLANLEKVRTFLHLHYQLHVFRGVLACTCFVWLLIRPW